MVGPGGQPLLASVGTDGTVQVWDPATSTCEHTLTVGEGVTAICTIGHDLAIGVRTGFLVISLTDPEDGVGPASPADTSADDDHVARTPSGR